MSIGITGADGALLVSVCFALHLWDFEQLAAQKIVPKDFEDEINNLSNTVSEQVHACFRIHVPARPPGTMWTRELIKQRTVVPCELELSSDEIKLAIVALRACEKEFTNNLTDFYVALPGNLDWYGIGMKEVRALVVTLKQYLED